jgi:hypothetical protein
LSALLCAIDRIMPGESIGRRHRNRKPRIGQRAR